MPIMYQTSNHSSGFNDTKTGANVGKKVIIELKWVKQKAANVLLKKIIPKAFCTCACACACATRVRASESIRVRRLVDPHTYKSK